MGVFDLLNPKIRELVKKRFDRPTNIQEIAIPEIISGKNVLVMAGTGFGKTESVILPVLNFLHEHPDNKIGALYITPLRSLNRDMFDRFFWWADKLDLEVSIRHGDTVQKERAEHRESPPNMLIITPESLQAVLTGKVMKKHLAQVRFVIIDEIHELVSSERGTQLSVALERLKRICGSFQTIGLSATVGTPEKVAEYIGNAKIVRSEIEKEIEVDIVLPRHGPEDEKLEDKLFVDRSCIARLREITNLINSHKSTLIFTNTRQTAEVLSSRLRAIDKSISQDVHHGSLSKEARIRNERLFKDRSLKALIATSSLELGIDIGSVDIVVQYLSPRQVTKLVQRVGRSGHKVGEKSYGVILTDRDDVFESAIINRHLREKKLEQTRMHEMALDVLAHQIVGMAIDEYMIKADAIFETIKKSYCFRNIDRKQFDEVLLFMSKLGLLFVDQTTGEVRRRKRAWQYYFENLSTIADIQQYKVVDIVTNEHVGMLDEAFVVDHCQPGNTFICKGRGWRVVQTDQNKVLVEPYDNIESAIPSWEGELIPVPMEIAQDVGKLRKMMEKPVDPDLMKARYGLDSNSIREMSSLIEEQKKYFIPDDKHIVIENYKDFIIIHSCFGSMVNDTLGRYISAVLNTRHGISVQMKTNPYSIIIRTLAKPSEIEDILKNVEDFEKMVIESLETSSLFKWKFVQVAKRFGIISRGAIFDKINVSKLISFYKYTPVWDETMREIMLEKLDIPNALKVIELIEKGSIKLSIRQGFSPLGKQNLIYQFGELIAPKEPTGEIFRLFKKRLLNTSLTLVCMNCGKFSITKKVVDVEDEPECPVCSSKLIGVVSARAHHLENIIKKKIRGGKLNEAEEREYERARRTADMVIVYGKKAVIVLSARGVGAETASRILAKLHPSEEKLLQEVFEAEKLFAKNKKYWK